MSTDRRDAGRPLARQLRSRGSVPVVAEVLTAPLDVRVVRKLAVPGHNDFVTGAIAEAVT